MPGALSRAVAVLRFPERKLDYVFVALPFISGFLGVEVVYNKTESLPCIF